MKKTVLCLLISYLTLSSYGQISKKEVQQISAESAQQYRLMKKELANADRFPTTFNKTTHKLMTSKSDWWCSGFYPGSLLYLYELTGDTLLYNEALRLFVPLQKEQFNKTTHDLGFMMYCSFGNANRLHPSVEYKQILINSAKSLAARFDLKVGCIRSWDSKTDDFLVIIDNMMNLEMLCWASRETGDSTYLKIAMTHANTTLKNHFRDNFSTFHLVVYDPSTGAVKKRQTVQGFSDPSSWARGQSWGLYGYTVMYRETGKKEYLNQAIQIANYMLHHPRLPKDKIPYWDFDDTKIPNVPRDASAASVTCSALLELQQYVDASYSKEYKKAAFTIFKSLSSPKYRMKNGELAGFVIDHCTGDLPKNKEVDVPLSYGDYYYFEAMKRIHDLQTQKR